MFNLMKSYRSKKAHDIEIDREMLNQLAIIYLFHEWFLHLIFTLIHTFQRYLQSSYSGSLGTADLSAFQKEKLHCPCQIQRYKVDLCSRKIDKNRRYMSMIGKVKRWTFSSQGAGATFWAPSGRRSLCQDHLVWEEIQRINKEYLLEKRKAAGQALGTKWLKSVAIQWNMEIKMGLDKFSRQSQKNVYKVRL